MALTFFWRCETTTLDATDDHSSGDTTASGTGSPSLNAAAARVGSLGILANADTRYYQFSPASGILSPSLGALGISLRLSGNPSSAGVFARALGSDTNNNISLSADDASGHLRVQIATATGPASGKSVLTTALTANVWLGMVIRWDDAGSRRAIEMYDATGALVESVTGGGFVIPTELGGALRFGNVNATGITAHVDNCMIGDTYDEPIQNNFTIASYVDYDDGSSSGLAHRLSGKLGGRLRGRLG